MKKSLALTLALILMLALAACGSEPRSGSSDETAPAQTEATAAQTEAAPAGETTANAAGLITDGSRIGVLQPVTEQNDLVVNGLILTSGSGHHVYPSVEELYAKGYQTEGLSSEYYLSEWINLYGEIEGGKAAQVIVLPNDPNADYTKMKTAELTAAHEQLPNAIFADSVAPDAQDYGHLCDFYVHQESPAGLYNVFFANGEEICYLVQLKLLPPEE